MLNVVIYNVLNLYANVITIMGQREYMLKNTIKMISFLPYFCWITLMHWQSS